MKTFRLFLAVVCGASLTANIATAFSIKSVTFSPADVVPAGTRLDMIVDIVTPSQGTWLYAPTAVSSNSNGIRVDIYPTSGMLTAIGVIRETVDLGTPPPGLHQYEVVIHPNFTVNWGVRTNQGTFIVQKEVLHGQLVLTEPTSGQQFAPGETIPLRATTTNEAGPWHVEFLSGDRRIATSTPNQPVWWSEAWGGEHVITARAINPQGTMLTSGAATIQVGPGPTVPVVSISSSWNTAEPCPTCLVAPGLILIRRTEPVSTSLRVFLDIGGTAAAGDDYQPLPSSVTMAPGQSSVQLTLLPKDDLLAEGPEVVRVRLRPSPDYLIHNYSDEALVVIRDDETNAPTARLDIIAPTNESRFLVGRTIELTALAVNLSNEVYGPVEFYAGDEFIARSQVTASTRPAIPGLPSIHTAYWTNPPVGQHTLTARTRLSFSQSITSPPVRIMVDSLGLPVVRLETWPATNAQAREFCPPNADCVYPSFVLRRTGPTNTDLSVFLSYSGTATPEADYPPLPSTAVIPAGRDAAFVMVVPTDDTFAEGPETIVARFTPVPGAGYLPDPSFTSATITIIDNDVPQPTVVSIRAEDARATEPPVVGIPELSDRARFRVFRSGDLSRDLLVFFSVDGSAVHGLDYHIPQPPQLAQDSTGVVMPPLPPYVVIRAGAESATIDIVPLYDQLTEGMETVLVTLEPSPVASPLPTYEIDSRDSFAVAGIFDALAEPGPAIQIVSPGEGDRFRLPTTVDIIVAAFHPALDIGGVDFYAGNDKIGEWRLAPELETAGQVVAHRFTWSQPREGTHALTARGFDETHTVFGTSAPVRITVEGDQSRNVVRIDTISPISEESSDPFARPNLTGVFRISRTGPTSNSLPVFVTYSGTARPGSDYEPLPLLVTIPQGSNATFLAVQPVLDNLPEGIETVVARISNCPSWPLGIPCYDFAIDPAHDSATVFIRDDGLTQASVAITQPTNGASFNPGAPILIEAVAIDLHGYISRVEFFDGNQRIGVSEVVFIQPPPPGTPIHHEFEWRGAASGAHTLTARAARPDGSLIVSEPVRITVGEGGNQPPTVAITRPVSGTEFPPNATIEIVADTRDPDGYVQTVEFFADGRKIGERRLVFILPPPPGQTQTFTFVWREPTPGAHVLTARSIDDDGGTGLSAPVEIRVTGGSLPIVTVVTTDCFAVEPSSNTLLNTASFRLQRFGPTNSSLTVRYALQGAAQNGVDYEMLTGSTVIPVGHSSVSVVIRPLADNLREGMENVILQIEEHPDYLRGRRDRAVAAIADTLLSLAANGTRLTRLPDRGLHVCFIAQSGHAFRVETSNDLRDWDTVFTTIAVDGALHFVEDDTAISPLRFYRIAPEP
jgi:hypothetical protein